MVISNFQHKQARVQLRTQTMNSRRDEYGWPRFVDDEICLCREQPQDCVYRRVLPRRRGSEQYEMRGHRTRTDLENARRRGKVHRLGRLEIPAIFGSDRRVDEFQRIVEVKDGSGTS